jgi:hypothetical protein
VRYNDITTSIFLAYCVLHCFSVIRVQFSHSYFASKTKTPVLYTRLCSLLLQLPISTRAWLRFASTRSFYMPPCRMRFRGMAMTACRISLRGNGMGFSNLLYYFSRLDFEFASTRLVMMGVHSITSSSWDSNWSSGERDLIQGWVLISRVLNGRL